MAEVNAPSLIITGENPTFAENTTGENTAAPKTAPKTEPSVIQKDDGKGCGTWSNAEVCKEPRDFPICASSTNSKGGVCDGERPVMVDVVDGEKVYFLYDEKEYKKYIQSQVIALRQIRDKKEMTDKYTALLKKSESFRAPTFDEMKEIIRGEALLFDSKYKPMRSSLKDYKGFGRSETLNDKGAYDFFIYKNYTSKEEARGNKLAKSQIADSNDPRLYDTLGYDLKEKQVKELRKKTPLYENDIKCRDCPEEDAKRPSSGSGNYVFTVFPKRLKVIIDRIKATELKTFKPEEKTKLLKHLKDIKTDSEKPEKTSNAQLKSIENSQKLWNQPWFNVALGTLGSGLVMYFIYKKLLQGPQAQQNKLSLDDVKLIDYNNYVTYDDRAAAAQKKTEAKGKGESTEYRGVLWDAMHERNMELAKDGAFKITFLDWSGKLAELFNISFFPERDANNPSIKSMPGAGKSMSIQGVSQVIKLSQLPPAELDTYFQKIKSDFPAGLEEVAERYEKITRANIQTFKDRLNTPKSDGSRYKGCKVFIVDVGHLESLGSLYKGLESKVGEILQNGFSEFESDGYKIFLFMDERHRAAVKEKIIGQEGETQSWNDRFKQLETREEISTVSLDTIEESERSTGKDKASGRRQNTIFQEIPSPEAIADMLAIHYRKILHDFDGVTMDAMKAIAVLGRRSKLDKDPLTAAKDFTRRVLEYAGSKGTRRVTAEVVSDCWNGLVESRRLYVEQVTRRTGQVEAFLDSEGRTELKEGKMDPVFRHEQVIWKGDNAAVRAEYDDAEASRGYEQRGLSAANKGRLLTEADEVEVVRGAKTTAGQRRGQNPGPATSGPSAEQILNALLTGEITLDDLQPRGRVQVEVDMRAEKKAGGKGPSKKAQGKKPLGGSESGYATVDFLMGGQAKALINAAKSLSSAGKEALRVVIRNSSAHEGGKFAIASFIAELLMSKVMSPKEVMAAFETGFLFGAAGMAASKAGQATQALISGTRLAKAYPMATGGVVGALVQVSGMLLGLAADQKAKTGLIDTKELLKAVPILIALSAKTQLIVSGARTLIQSFTKRSASVPTAILSLGLFVADLVALKKLAESDFKDNATNALNSALIEHAETAGRLKIEFAKAAPNASLINKLAQKLMEKEALVRRQAAMSSEMGIRTFKYIQEKEENRREQEDAKKNGIIVNSLFASERAKRIERNYQEDMERLEKEAANRAPVTLSLKMTPEEMVRRTELENSAPRLDAIGASSAGGTSLVQESSNGWQDKYLSSIDHNRNDVPQQVEALLAKVGTALLSAAMKRIRSQKA